jgi:endonuclease YncB( thermonuclease family)
VTDGDTIKLNGNTYRLWGIDAPESKQWCGDYPAGVLATAALEKLPKGRAIICEDRGHDRYCRTISLCRADGDDLSAAMVRHGVSRGIQRGTLARKVPYSIPNFSWSVGSSYSTTKRWNASHTTAPYQSRRPSPNKSA